VFSKDPNFNPKNVAGMKCVDNKFVPTGRTEPIMKGLCDCSYKPSGTTYFISNFKLPVISTSETYSCIAPKEAKKAFFIHLDFGKNIKPVSSSSLTSKSLVIELTNSDKFEISGKSYPDGVPFSLQIGVVGTKIEFANTKENSCILKIKKK